ncbi:porin family protein [Limibacter armeniacum]|uniref:porin family protein n=1 Tax=Limibacter armeniacum TaxID=466084 RepID=UPI002FE6BBC3
MKKPFEHTDKGFEKAWAEQFDGASIKPSNEVWESVDQHLEQKAMDTNSIDPIAIMPSSDLWDKIENKLDAKDTADVKTNQAWQSATENAFISPSSEVWNNIEQSLEQKASKEQVWVSQMQETSITPSAQVWEAVEAKLEKKRARIIPLWFSSGLAAAASIILIVSISYFGGYKSNDINPEEIAQQSNSRTNKQALFKSNALKTESKSEEVKNNTASSNDGNIAIPPVATSIASVSGTPNNSARMLADTPSVQASQPKVFAAMAVQNTEYNIEQHNIESELADRNGLKLAGFPRMEVPQLKREASYIPIEDGSEQNALFAAAFFSPRQQSQVSQLGTTFNGNLYDGVQFAADVESAVRNNKTVAAIESENDYKLKSSISFGGKIGKELSNNWFLQTGLEYMKFEFEASSKYVVAPDINSEGNVSSTEISRDISVFDLMETEDYTKTHLFDILSIPVEVGYRLLDKKVKLSVNTGLSANFALNHTYKTTLENDIESSYIEDELNKFFISATIGTEVGYDIMPKLMLILSPNYRHALTKFSNDDTLLGAKPSNFGVLFGLKYTLD